MQNARELKVDLSDVTEVILSHHHGDHVGGLLALRRELAKQKPDALKKAYVGAGIFLSRPGPESAETNEALLLKNEYEELGGSFVRDRSADRDFPGRLADRAGPAHASRAKLELQAHDPEGGWRASSRTTFPRTCRWWSTPIKDWSSFPAADMPGSSTRSNMRDEGSRDGRSCRPRGLSPVRGRRGDTRLDGREAPHDGGPELSRLPLHGHRIRFRAAAKARTEPRDVLLSERSARGLVSSRG